MLAIRGIQDNHSPKNTQALVDTLKAQISELQVQLENALFMSVPQRVTCALLKLAAFHSLDPAGFTLPVSKSTIAMRLGIHNETFSRVIPRLPSMGVLVRDKAVQIDLPRAQKSVCSGCSGQDLCKAYQMFHARASAPRTPQRTSMGIYSRQP